MARTTAFMPALSPPDVRTAIFMVVVMVVESKEFVEVDPRPPSDVDSRRAPAAFGALYIAS